jgi:multicomponent Na+:H+ antiporter subunit D
VSAEWLILASLLLPVLAVPLLTAVGRRPNLREAVTLCGALLLALVVISLALRVADGERPALHLWNLLPGIGLSFRAEPLGLLFASVAACLWPLNSVYSIGYMRANGEAHQTRFYVCFALALWGVMGMALAANLLTFFLFYEVLTLSTYPLVAHKGDAAARAGGRSYLAALLGTSILLLLPAIIWTAYAAETLEFRPGGILAGRLPDTQIALLLALYMFGIAKAALMPFHRWLPAAMVAPTPVSALLHAVAVVKAGVFAVLKVSLYVFGLDVLDASGATTWLLWVAAFTVLAASLVALGKDNLKARLAYSTVSQLSYVVIGAALANSMGVIGGALQIAMHAMGKITLFFCAGAIYTAHHLTQVRDLDGLGRRMPITFAAFLIGALSIIGLPPLGGTWSKWYLLLASAEAGQQLLMGVLLLSTLLNIAYLLPIPARGFFLPGTSLGRPGWQEAPLLCVLPLVITALGCVALYHWAGALVRFLEPLIAGS